MDPRSIKIQGPLFSNYSYAKVNRGFVRGLLKLGEFEVHAYCAKDKIDKWPEEKDFNLFPYMKEVWKEEDIKTDVGILFDFPKGGASSDLGVKGLNSELKFVAIAWEETVFPKNWIEEMNKEAHAVLAASTFVKDILTNNGIKIPVLVLHDALDEDIITNPSEPYQVETKKKFKFLHISTAKKRKGVDVLIKAYFEEFTDQDDVTLIVKSSPGPDNEVDSLISKYKTENSPEVIHINNASLTDEQIKYLIEQSDCGVYPSRSEGFGLVQLETMFIGKPLIATNYSAYLDFVNEDNSFLIGYKLVNAFESEQANIGSKWAEPDINDLKKQMRFVFDSENREVVENKVAKAKEDIKDLNWDNTAINLTKIIKQTEHLPKLKNLNLGVISPYNTQGGIEDYTEQLYTKMSSSFKEVFYIANKDVSTLHKPDESNVTRTWTMGTDNFEETIKFILENKIDILHIQYHSESFFKLIALDTLIENLKSNADIQIFVTLHSVKSEAFNNITGLKNWDKVDKVFIHSNEDFEYAKTLLQNSIHFSHPTEEIPKRNISEAKKALGIEKFSPVIATHGLLNVNKNIDKVIEATMALKQELPNMLYIALNSVVPDNIFAQGELEKITNMIKEKKLDNIKLITEFLDKEVIQLIIQTVDVVIFAYTEAGESASGAVRKALAAGKPTIVSDIKMFDEFQNEVIRITDVEPETIAGAVKKILSDETLRKKLTNETSKYVKANSYLTKMLETSEYYGNNVVIS